MEHHARRIHCRAQGTYPYSPPPHLVFPTNPPTQCYYGAAICFVISTTLVKISISLQYIRVFRTFPVFCRICWATIIFLCLWLLAMILALSAFCRVEGTQVWDLQSVGSKCQIRSWWAHASVGIVTDFFLIALPVPVVLRMKTSRAVAHVYLYPRWSVDHERFFPGQQHLFSTRKRREYVDKEVQKIQCSRAHCTDTTNEGMNINGPGHPR